MKLTITIELENEAMQTGEEVATALRKITDHIVGRYGLISIGSDSGQHLIFDASGNSVGQWEVS